MPINPGPHSPGPADCSSQASPPSLVAAPSHESRLWLTGAYLLLLVVLTLFSEPRRVGDGGEYIDMADDFVRGVAPTVQPHFWFYSALVAPAMAVLNWVDVNPLASFTLVNLALLGAACWLASQVLSPIPLVLLFVSPIIWWVDKPHTEVLTFAALVVAFAGLPARDSGPSPRAASLGLAVAGLGAAGTQNLPLTILMGAVIVTALATRTVSVRDRAFQVGCLVGAALAALPFFYYYSIGSRLVPLLSSTHGEVPNRDELVTAVLDSNVGLLVAAPAGALAIVVLAGALLRRPRTLVSPDVVLAGGATGLFLWGFAQTTNINSGGTPGMMRYGVWLIPLAIPLLRRSALVVRSIWGWIGLGTLAAASAALSITMFRPALPEEFLRPTLAAETIWTRAPFLERPVPEVFVERLRHQDGNWWVPVATPQCEKVLFTGRGEDGELSQWPVTCAPASIPPVCRTAGQLCYANRWRDGYLFSVVPPPSFWDYKFERDQVWTGEEVVVARWLLDKLAWWEMERLSSNSEAFTVEAELVSGWAAPDRLFVYARHPSPESALTVQVPAAMAGAFFDGLTGQRLSEVGAPAAGTHRLEIPAAHPSVMLVLHADGLASW